MKRLVIVALAMSTAMVWGQQAIYDVTAGDGNGLRFWSQDYYKIHMGRGTDYQYGSVTDYSIKFNMNNDPTRGWTWGVHGAVPVAALNTQGIFKVASSFYAGPLLGNTNAIGRISVSGAAAELSLVNRDVSNFIDSPTNGERWVIYNQGSPDGRLRFWSGGDKMTLTRDGLLGIGTSSPGAPLHVKSNGGGSHLTIETDAVGEGDLRWNQAGTDRAAIQVNSTTGDFEGHVFGSSWVRWLSVNRQTANVGIGTSSPAAKLDVNGQIAVNGVPVITSGGTDVYANIRVLRNTSTQLTDGLYLGYNGSGGPIRFFSNSGTTELMTLTTSGNLGIGTTSPNQKLTVNGTIYGKEVKVDLNVPGPDYVFEKDYKLPSLDEIKSYVDQHKHLPEVPSAKEMEQNGINLSEMNMVLLKKVEELTLMMIHMKNINDVQSAWIQNQTKEIAELRNHIQQLEANEKQN